MVCFYSLVYFTKRGNYIYNTLCDESKYTGKAQNMSRNLKYVDCIDCLDRASSIVSSEMWHGTYAQLVGKNQNIYRPEQYKDSDTSHYY